MWKHSDTTGTAALSYEKGGLLLRVAGTYRDAFVDSFGGETLEEEIIQVNFQWDVTASYRIRDNILLFAEFININDEPLETFYSVSNQPHQFEAHG